MNTFSLDNNLEELELFLTTRDAKNAADREARKPANAIKTLLKGGNGTLGGVQILTTKVVGERLDTRAVIDFFGAESLRKDGFMVPGKKLEVVSNALELVQASQDAAISDLA